MPKCKIGLFLTKGTKEYKTRLSTKKKHELVKLRDCRKVCIVCCATCSAAANAGRSTVKHSRKGKNTSWKCSVCDIVLCKKDCFDNFHSKEVSMPTCFKLFRGNKLAHKGSSQCIVAKTTKSTNHAKEVKKVVIDKENETRSKLVEGGDEDSTSSSQLQRLVNNEDTPTSSQDEHPSHTISPGDIIEYYDETRVKGTTRSYVQSQVLKLNPSEDFYCYLTTNYPLTKDSLVKIIS